MSTREKVRFGKVMLTGVFRGAVGEDTLVLLEDNLGNVLFATGSSVPADGSSGYAKGCLFINTTPGPLTAKLYCNKGITTSCSFTLITQA